MKLRITAKKLNKQIKDMGISDIMLFLHEIVNEPEDVDHIVKITNMSKDTDIDTTESMTYGLDNYIRVVAEHLNTKILHKRMSKIKVNSSKNNDIGIFGMFEKVNSMSDNDAVVWLIKKSGGDVERLRSLRHIIVINDPVCPIAPMSKKYNKNMLSSDYYIYTVARDIIERVRRATGFHPVNIYKPFICERYIDKYPITIKETDFSGIVIFYIYLSDETKHKKIEIKVVCSSDQSEVVFKTKFDCYEDDTHERDDNIPELITKLKLFNRLFNKLESKIHKDGSLVYVGEVYDESKKLEVKDVRGIIKKYTKENA
jgi:hypothetical protein